MLLADNSEPRKAYYVERVGRYITTGVIFADSVEDAKRRYLAGDYEQVFDTVHEGRGFGKVRRAPQEDR